MIVKCRTDKGKVRELNEDYVLSLSGGKYVLVIVADGMGGYNAGEIASKMSATIIRDYVFKKFPEYEDKEELIRDAILAANEEIYTKQLEDEKLKGMGTTTTCGIIYDNNIYIGHVGDSRAYLIFDEGIKKITTDHSFVQELLNNGSITENEAQNHPQRNLITRAVGTEKYVVVDTSTVGIDECDRILLCSDGLTIYVSDSEIFDAVSQKGFEAVDELVEIAIERGGRDNITVLMAGGGEENE